MSQIYNVRNGGNGRIRLGMFKVNSYNVAPTTYVALPTPFLTIPNDIWLNNDWINATQTSAATDAIFLPTPVGTSAQPNQFFPAAGVGSEYRVYAVTAMKVLPPVDAVSTINGGTNVQGISLSAGALGIFTATKVAGVGLTWVCNMIVPAGTLSAPVPS